MTDTNLHEYTETRTAVGQTYTVTVDLRDFTVKDTVEWERVHLYIDALIAVEEATV